MEFKPVPAKITDPKVGLTKAEHYCAYQERSQQEVRNKLYDWGLYPRDVEQILSTLIENNFLSEERFAKAYVQGKFNQKGWGRIKIKQGLKLKRVPDVLIRKALSIIDTDAYEQALKHTLEKKARLLNEKNAYKRNYKLQQYALNRGFESELVADMLKDLE
ncbi:RecX family transcriptional regulator [Mucilaginibacter sp. PPCGB 2223]|uniref:regulatory protein RecX n=1 Tax=Mucilaginibacter sp. PPCGB 2223 TaxID=1886027 RepID=UPI0008240D2A|nr:regulatory protein RecX [Mucilaginibacter sp. PPCGB 2223]OCX53763.1 RecX family transcriptional regulator [Mucilaginibacter sp. PPCGB 2223]